MTENENRTRRLQLPNDKKVTGDLYCGRQQNFCRPANSPRQGQFQDRGKSEPTTELINFL